MARIGFDAAVLAKILGKFKEGQLETMELVVDTNTRQAMLEVVGLRAARALLKELGLVEGKDFRVRDAIEVAGMTILEMEDERGKDG